MRIYETCKLRLIHTIPEFFLSQERRKQLLTLVRRYQTIVL